jgi:hypothetical protein
VIYVHVSVEDVDNGVIRVDGPSVPGLQEGVSVQSAGGRFEMHNTLHPGVNTLCGGLQGSSLVSRMLEN